MGLGIKGEITSQPHAYGDAFFGAKNFGSGGAAGLDVVNQVAVPVAVSLISGILLYVMLGGRKKKR